MLAQPQRIHLQNELDTAEAVVMDSEDDLSLSSAEMCELFDAYKARVHDYMPIVDLSRAPGTVYVDSRFLFWTICFVGARAISATPDRLALIERLNNLVIRYSQAAPFSGEGRRGEALYTVQALLILTMFDYSDMSLLVNRSWLFCGLATHLSHLAGIHDEGEAIYSTAKHDRLNCHRTWAACYVVNQLTAASEGRPPTIQANLLIRKLLASPESLPLALYGYLHMAYKLESAYFITDLGAAGEMSEGSIKNINIMLEELHGVCVRTSVHGGLASYFMRAMTNFIGLHCFTRLYQRSNMSPLMAQVSLRAALSCCFSYNCVITEILDSQSLENVHPRLYFVWILLSTVNAYRAVELLSFEEEEVAILDKCVKAAFSYIESKSCIYENSDRGRTALQVVQKLQVLRLEHKLDTKSFGFFFMKKIVHFARSMGFESFLLAGEPTAAPMQESAQSLAPFADRSSPEPPSISWDLLEALFSS